MTAAMHRRARLARQRALIRAWQYRQRHHAKGVWHRLRRLLAVSEAAYAIAPEQAAALAREGLRPELAAAEIEPARTWLFVPAARLAAITEREPLPLRLCPRLLAAPCVALVAFAE
jgi:hypothetical protein